MNTNQSGSSFQRRIKRGRAFEKWERDQWIGDLNSLADFEAPTKWKGKRGRIDIKLVDSEEDHTIIVELKASNWDKMKPHRVRPNALRHSRQIWRYIEAELSERSVLPAIIYPASPKLPGRKELIEEILGERLIQVVWRDEMGEIDDAVTT
jgi:hypothetical protein